MTGVLNVTFFRLVTLIQVSLSLECQFALCILGIACLNDRRLNIRQNPTVNI